jgi:alcohol dehydrogenase class IV
MRRIERALQAAGPISKPGSGSRPDGSSAAAAIFDLARDQGAPTALRDLGMPAAGLDRAADLAVENRYPNPRPLERAALRELLQRAWEGTRPD